MAESFRLRFNFWLDVTKSHENEVAAEIEQLKTDRLFTKTVRDGIRLIVSLRRRDTSVLYELFPWLQETASKPIEPPHGDNGHDDQIKALQTKIDTLTDLVAQQGAPGSMVMSARENQKVLSPPKTDNIVGDGLVITKATKSPENAGFNMLLNSAAMNVCRYEDLPSVVIAYGVERGKIPAGKVPEGVLYRSEGGYLENANPRKLAGADAVIAVAVFDDLDAIPV